MDKPVAAVHKHQRVRRVCFVFLACIVMEQSGCGGVVRKNKNLGNSQHTRNLAVRCAVAVHSRNTFGAEHLFAEGIGDHNIIGLFFFFFNI